MGRSGSGARRTGTVAAAFVAATIMLGVLPVGAARGSVIARPSQRPRALPEAVDGEIVVSYRPDARGSGIARARASAGVERARGIAPDLEVVTVPPGVPVERAIEDLSSDPSVLHAEPNRIFYASDVVPDDLFFGDQWGLDNLSRPDADIAAPQAWSRATGAPDVVIAVVDTGVALDHPDLAENMWTNPGESGDGKEANGVDDDGNGKVDDWQGWDWIEGDNEPYDEHEHGTHVAGIAGAQGNNSTGVTGVAWDVQLMPLRVLDATGAGTLEDIAAAFHYAGRMGAHVVNASLGAIGWPEPNIIKDAIEAYRGTLFVVAAGNDGVNNDSVPTWPCNHASANLVCVAATESNDTRADYSNYSSTHVDIAAPGSGVLSTSLDEPAGYEYMWGTSMATPFVAGAAALVWSERPAGVARSTWRRHVVAVLRSGAQRTRDWMPERLAFGGRLNLDRTLRYTGDLIEPTGVRMLGLRERFRASTHYPVRFTADDSGGAGLRSHDVRVRRAPASAPGFTSWRTWRAAVRSTRLPFTGRGGTTYCYSTRARDNAFNLSGWGPQRCTAVPLDDRAMLVTDGWQFGTHDDSYRYTFSRTSTRGAALRVPKVRYRTLALIATTCPTCGKVQIVRGSQVIKTMSLRSARIRRAQVLPIAHVRRVRGPAPITIVVVSRSKPVIVEGLGISRL